ncbi:AzlD domain-containing protein [Xanthobacter sp. KR7-225]|uniref:AzlD family protein n=1 Tax=Xanthobacter sp. KR7-225 TaxID=3156613 RepID=UPI0032B4E6EE
MSAIDPGTLLAIGVMAAATIFNRTAGFFLMRLVPVTPRVRRVLDALPGAVLVALLVPSAVKGDAAMLSGLAAALAVAKLTRSDFLAVIAAMAVAAAIRAFH